MQKNYKVPLKIKETIANDRVQSALKEMESHILQNFDLKNGDVAIVGVQTRGAAIANRIASAIKKAKGIELPVGALDITLYRDDFSSLGVQPVVGETHLDFDLDGKKIILIDDVLFTGRTIRAAIDELIDFGRPKSISLLVLIDRGHRELPIAPDFAAITIQTKREEMVNLHLQEIDQREDIVVCEATHVS